MRRRPMCILCLLLMFGIWTADCLGLPLFRERPLSESQERQWLEGTVTVRGILQEKVEKETSFSIYLKNAVLTFPSKTIPIKNTKIYMEEKIPFPRGTILSVRGILHGIDAPRNPGEFDNPVYYETQGIYYTMSGGHVLAYSGNPVWYEKKMEDFKERLSVCFGRIGGKYAGIFQAMLLGDKSGLDPQIKSQYQMAGIIHILAISGLHLSILGSGFFQILKRVGAGNGLAGILALAVMIPYGVMTGSSVATMRSVIMFLIGIGAKISGRSYDLLSSLSVAAILILLECPACLYYSGFQLSFGAVLGLGGILPILQEAWKDSPLAAPFLGAVSVHLVMIPLLLHSFSEVSVLGIFLNLLVIPTVGGVLISGLAGVAAGLLSLSAGKLLILPGKVLLAVYNGLGDLCCRFPFCTWVGGKPEFWQIVIYYLLLIFVMEFLRRSQNSRKTWKKMWKGMLAALYVLSLAVLGWKDCSGLRITFLDVGQGDGIVLEDQGECYLIDGGSTSQSMVGTYRILPFIKSRGISKIQAVFVTHTDEDHCNGVMEILKAQTAHTTSVRVKRLVLPAWQEKPETYVKLEGLAEKAGIPIFYVRRGESLKIKDLRMSVKNPGPESDPEDTNGGSIVLQMEYGEFRGLFTGDIGEEQEREILGGVQKCTLLKVAHHGSKNSSCEEFLKKVHPWLSVISVAEENLYGHPHPAAVSRLKKWSKEVRMTKEDGAIQVWTDGRKMKVKSFTGF